MNRFFILLMAVLLNTQEFVFAHITWDNFDLISQFKLLQLGISKKQVAKWNLKNFDGNFSYQVQREDKSVAATLLYVKPNKYKVARPLTVVSYTKEKSSSCHKDKYKDSYAMHKIRSLENIEQEVLIDRISSSD